MSMINIMYIVGTILVLAGPMAYKGKRKWWLIPIIVGLFLLGGAAIFSTGGSFS